MYSIIPDEVIFAEPKTTSYELREVNYKNKTIVLKKLKSGKVIVDRVVSSNLKDSLYGIMPGDSII